MEASWANAAKGVAMIERVTATAQIFSAITISLQGANMRMRRQMPHLKGTPVHRKGTDVIPLSRRRSGSWRRAISKHAGAFLLALGSNLIIKDKILSIDREKCLFPVKKISKEVRAIRERFEPINTVEKQRQFEQTCSQSPTLLGDLESNQD